MRIDWFYLFAIVVVICVAVYFVVRLYFPPTCADWAANGGTFNMTDYTGDEFERRYERCMSERKEE